PENVAVASGGIEENQSWLNYFLLVIDITTASGQSRRRFNNGPDAAMKKLSFAVLAFAAAMAAGAGSSVGAEPPSSTANQGEGQEFHADISVQNNMTFGSVQAASERNTGEVSYDAGRDGRFEVNATCGRRITPLFSAFGGVRVHHKDEP